MESITKLFILLDEDKTLSLPVVLALGGRLVFPCITLPVTFVTKGLAAQRAT